MEGPCPVPASPAVTTNPSTGTAQVLGRQFHDLVQVYALLVFDGWILVYRQIGHDLPLLRLHDLLANVARDIDRHQLDPDSGSTSAPFGQRVTATPIDALWAD